MEEMTNERNQSTLMTFENCEFSTECNDVPNMCCGREEDAMSLLNQYKTYVYQNKYFKLKEHNEEKQVRTEVMFEPVWLGTTWHEWRKWKIDLVFISVYSQF